MQCLEPTSIRWSQPGIQGRGPAISDRPVFEVILAHPQGGEIIVFALEEEWGMLANPGLQPRSAGQENCPVDSTFIHSRSQENILVRLKSPCFCTS